jgi:hypothetical protein
MTMVQLRLGEFGTGGPLLLFASEISARESGASTATRGGSAKRSGEVTTGGNRAVTGAG